jgi:hypothetical protein
MHFRDRCMVYGGDGELEEALGRGMDEVGFGEGWGVGFLLWG